MWQYLLCQFLKHFRCGPPRELDTQRGMVDAGTLPFAQQVNQAFVPGLQDISAAQWRPWMVAVRHQIDPFIAHVRPESAIWNQLAPGADLFSQALRPLARMGRAGIGQPTIGMFAYPRQGLPR